MFRTGFNGCGQTKGGVGGCCGAGDDINQFHMAFGKRAGFIEHGDIDAPRLFEYFSAFNDDAQLSTTTGTDHDRSRRCEPESAWASDDENSNRGRERVLCGMACHGPADDRCDRNAKHDRNENAGNTIGETLNWCSGTLSVFNELHDLRECCVVADSCCFDDEMAVGIDCCADNVVAGANLNGNRFTSDHRHIDCGMAFDNNAIGCNFFAGTNNKPNADNEVFEGNLGAVFKTCGLDAEFCEFAQSIARPSARACFKPLPQEDERNDYACSFEIHMGGIAACRHAGHAAHCIGGLVGSVQEEKRDGRPRPGCQGPH